VRDVEEVCQLPKNPFDINMRLYGGLPTQPVDIAEIAYFEPVSVSGMD
jgi:hypothetical protein